MLGLSVWSCSQYREFDRLLQELDLDDRGFQLYFYRSATKFDHFLSRISFWTPTMSSSSMVVLDLPTDHIINSCEHIH